MVLRVTKPSSGDEEPLGGRDRRGGPRLAPVGRRDRQPAGAPMSVSTGKRMIMAAACAVALAPSAHAEDFFSALFGAIGRGLQPPSSNQPPFGGDPSQSEPPRPRVGGPAWCVRTCDGRYFPIPPSEQSRATVCNNFCPAAETKVVYGSSIDAAATEDGKPYSQLPNAFRYRSELVAGCTCNGHDKVGLAQIPIEDDPTLRRGDLVAGPSGGLSAASNDASRRAQSSYSQAPDPVRAR
jgi:Protein of unknown function (DUF2865)